MTVPVSTFGHPRALFQRMFNRHPGLAWRVKDGAGMRVWPMAGSFLKRIHPGKEPVRSRSSPRSKRFVRLPVRSARSPTTCRRAIRAAHS